MEAHGDWLLSQNLLADLQLLSVFFAKAVLIQELAVCAFSPSTWEEEVEKLEGHPQLCSKTEASLGYM